jgi:FOG: TPR repeat, SEL1 subfamily
MFSSKAFSNKNTSRLFTALTGPLVVSSIIGTDTFSRCYDDEEDRNFDQTLQRYKNQLEYYKDKWNWHNSSSRIPTVSWPTNIPDEKTYGSLLFESKLCRRRKDPNDDGAKYCQDVRFRIASYMLLQADESTQKVGLCTLKQLAEEGHPDGICAYATCLNEGRGGLEINPKAAVSWWMNACEKYDHTQSNYELGVAFYTGEGVAENEAIAVEYFRRAADNGHAGAAYMLGDCLLDGIGVSRDRGEALEWLVTSAELGHRGARSRVLAVLTMDDSKDYGKFTDSSRQSLARTVSGKREARFEHGKKRDTLEKQYSGRPVSLERRFTIGGGASNPQILNRRKSIVDESRFDQ